jgi:thioredoxin-like negative regulator of GroEL
VWQQALAGVEVNHEAAEIFLRSEYASRDPIIKALVLHSLGRNEEAFTYLEQLVEHDETWRDDLFRRANVQLKGLKEVDEDRYGALMPFLDE